MHNRAAVRPETLSCKDVPNKYIEKTKTKTKQKTKIKRKLKNW
jgi:translation elongation factor EF-Ts